jgi:hypothetical protein
MAIDFADIQALPLEQQIELELLLLKSFQHDAQSGYQLAAEEWASIDSFIAAGRHDPRRWEDAIEFLKGLDPIGYWDPRHSRPR